jgi:nucleotide-binding universal stress UspA family protein
VPFEAKLSRTIPQSSLAHYRELGARQAAIDMEAFGAATGLQEATRILRHGPAAVRVREYARDFDADLVVVGAEERSALESALLGSVSLHLVTELQCDVLLARAQRRA